MTLGVDGWKGFTDIENFFGQIVQVMKKHQLTREKCFFFVLRRIITIKHLYGLHTRTWTQFLKIYIAYSKKYQSLISIFLIWLNFKFVKFQIGFGNKNKSSMNSMILPLSTFLIFPSYSYTKAHSDFRIPDGRGQCDIFNNPLIRFNPSRICRSPLNQKDSYLFI